ncbi:SGNH/GDSL hydrolase family protein [Oceanobacillus alkalisoli]|uniref:SGNH/GDSL hydrolase family protein n=1 Tax=Oceanobacillus alkalisoli TaxID=2925113 RepID=UPI001F11E433|nr:SGNH/GDSL hydrolase family protein [Oceanobacillus alkalisoli]MCF3943509.1 SGNH/GDSL hydrolase family protein [Oceanobacillus alkalisoli]
MKKILFILFAIILLTIGILYYIDSQPPALNQPLIPEENEEELMEETEPIQDDQDEVEETAEEENSFSERLSHVVKDTFGRIFQREVKIVAIGDSLTRGVGDTTNSGGYVGILERSLNQEEEIATFENFGIPGNRTDQLLIRLGQPEIIEALEEANIVLVTIGANDIMEVAKENITNLEIKDFIQEHSDYEERLEEILETLSDINSNADIYLLGIYNPFERYFQDIEELNQIVNTWNETGSSLANEMDNITFIPIIDLFAGNEDPIFADDNFHPNYAGYYLMAERVLDYISREEG